MKALALGVVLATLVGCASQRTAPTQPISGSALDALRTEFMQADPNARLGAVEKVDESLGYLMINQVSSADFPVGTAVAIFDSNKQVVANGEVVKTFESAAHVKYQKSGQRPPRVGDVAVRF